jgi:hypothetical protein
MISHTTAHRGQTTDYIASLPDKPLKTYGKGRQCAHCQTTLSNYNPTDTCGSCERKGKKPKTVKPVGHKYVHRDPLGLRARILALWPTMTACERELGWPSCAMRNYTYRGYTMPADRREQLEAAIAARTQAA